MKHMRNVVLFGAFALAACVAPAAATVISGTVATSEWTSSGNPYRITDHVLVPEGATLTIGPGVDVVFDAVATFEVQGALRVRGTADSMVSFSPGDSSSWGGFLFGGVETSTMRHAVISGADSSESVNELNIGGAVTIDGLMGARVSLYGCEIINNRGLQGAGIYSLGAVVSVDSCLFSGNRSRSGGGAVAVFDGSFAATSSAIVGNNAGQGAGGAIYVESGTHSLSYCTITADTAATGAGGVHVTGSMAMVGIDGSIVWGNEPPGEGVVVVDGLGTISYSDVETYGDAWSGPGNLNVDPAFVDPLRGDWSLQRTSPCVDAGDPMADPDPDGTRADMGSMPVDQREPLEVFGRITTRTWPGDSTYHVTGVCSVLVGDTLTIAPGARIVFDAEASFVVRGSLFSLGASDDPVHFEAGDALRWFGLAFEDTDSSALVGTEIRGVVGSVVSVSGASSLLLSDVVIEGNTGDDGSGLRVMDGARVHVKNADFINNAGTVVYMDGGSAAVFDSALIASIDVIADEQFARGVHVRGGSELRMTRSTVSFQREGAVVADTNSVVRLVGCRLEYNRPLTYEEAGGTLLVYSAADVELRYTFITGNLSYQSGAAFLLRDAADVRLINCTMAENMSEGGMAMEIANSSVSVVNTISYLNMPVEIAYDPESTVSVRYSNIERDPADMPVFPGEGNIKADPQFTKTPGEYYRLAAGSSCIGAGDPSTTDPAGRRPDMGAFYDGDVVPVWDANPLPATASLGANYPNPFNPSTTIEFALPGYSRVRLAVFNLAGQQVRVLTERALPAGTHSVRWDGKDSRGRPAASGVYLYRLSINDGRSWSAITRRMVLVR